MTGIPMNDSAERVLGGARAEATRLGHEAVGAEHIVLSLLREEAAAPRLFATLGLVADGLRERLEAGGRKSRVRSAGGEEPSPDATPPSTELPLTSHARRIIELAGREARDRNTGVDGEHLLVAVVSEPRGTIARLLNEASVTPAQARAEALRVLGGVAPATSEAGGAGEAVARREGARPRAESGEGDIEEPVSERGQVSPGSVRSARGGEDMALPAAASPPAEPVAAGSGGAGSAPPEAATEQAPARSQDLEGPPVPDARERRRLAREARPPREPRDPREPKAERVTPKEKDATKEGSKDQHERRREETGDAGRPSPGTRPERPERGDRSAPREPREVRPRDAGERDGRQRGRDRGPDRVADRPDERLGAAAAVAVPEAEPRPRKVLPHLEAARYSIWGPLWRRVLLLAVPTALVLGYTHQSPMLVFAASALGIVPLAALMGDATEHLAHRTRPAFGGLLNATFGNAAELIIALVALQAGQVALVKASITGSILGNLLLILGLALLAAGGTRTEVRFNRTAAGMSAAMLALAVVGLVFPALFHATHPTGAQRLELFMSEGVAVVLAITYALSLVFSLKTHTDLFGSEGHAINGPVWPVGRAVLVLAGATVLVALLSELLVHAVEPVTKQLGLSEMFLGLIIIPIVGNAAEHAAAVLVARKGQADLALHIALGSSSQVALLVAPVLVFAGVAMGRSMDLVFQPFEVMALGLATVVTAIITLDGESHWFEGVQLLAVYALVAVAAFFI